jgi:GNAT superfamily N-acetyltransferase
MTQQADPHLTLEHERTAEGHTRVKLVHDGREISGASVVPMTIQVGIAPVRMDGIGGVATDESHRFKGYSRRVLEACIEFMKQGDAPLTTLYGIPNFYPKFGYATLGPEPKINLDLAHIPEPFPAGYSARRMEATDLPAVRALYDAGSDQSIGPLVRDEQWFSWRKLAESIAKGDDEARVVIDPAGTVAGYAWLASWCWWMDPSTRKQDDTLRIAEAFAASPQAADAVLAACRSWVGERGLGKVQLLVPPDSRIGTAAALRGAMIGLQHTFEGEYMGRSLDVVRLFRDLQPELMRRWARGAQPWRGTLVVDTGEDRVALTLGETSLDVGEDAGTAGATVVALSPGSVARLVFGGFGPDDVLARGGVAGAAADVLSWLFPREFPYIYPADRF